MPGLMVGRKVAGRGRCAELMRLPGPYTCKLLPCISTMGGAASAAATEGPSVTTTTIPPHTTRDNTLQITHSKRDHLLPKPTHKKRRAAGAGLVLGAVVEKKIPFP